MVPYFSITAGYLGAVADYTETVRPPSIIYLFCRFGSLGCHYIACHLKVYSADEIRC